MVKLREELASDLDAIEALLDLSFGADRGRKASYAFRRGVPCVSELSLVAADDDNAVVASIRYWPLDLEGRPVLLLGPIAVHPDLHGRGIGRALVFTSLTTADSLGFETIFLVGDPDYYQRFGFAVAPANIVMPGEQPWRLQFRLLGNASLPTGFCELRPQTKPAEMPAFSSDSCCRSAAGSG